MRYHCISLLKKLLLGVGLLLVSLVATASDKVIVMTSYPQEVITHFEEAFEKAYPEYRLEVIWKQSNDALSYIKNNRQQVDLYWTPSRNNFKELSGLGYFLKIDQNITDRNPAINGLLLNDPQGNYVATEIAGLGMVVNQAELKKLNLDLPTDWSDLANPSYQAKIAFPIPSKIGFANGLLDAMLQDKSWHDGWSKIQQIAANSSLLDSGSTFITEEVASGRQAIGITMDFFATSAIAKGSNLIYVYPPHISYSPAHIAILKDAPNKNGAKAFLDFVLSAQGQTLLFHPDISKLPVNPQAYANKPQGYFNPFEHGNPMKYKSRAGDSNQQLILNSLFDAMVTKHHEKLTKLFSQLHQAKSAYPSDSRLNEVFQLISTPVITEQEANEQELLIIFNSRKSDLKAQDKALSIELAWSSLAAARYTQAESILYTIMNH
jgi:ABC-type Fe3+ transport system substrate-binding protein